MKNQYFGDLNDFKKYGLLRALSGSGRLSTAVCWTLTENDSRSDGSRIRYLREPTVWRNRDPILFDHLREQVLRKGVRRVRAIERAGVLPNCRFFGGIVGDDATLRDDYFERFFRFAEGAELIFFDPDNGLGVKSVARGRKRSSKYLYQCELDRAFRVGHSVLFYQHFPRRPRDKFFEGLVHQLGRLRGLKSIFSFSSSHVAFILLPQPHHEANLIGNTEEFARRWDGLVRINRYRLSAPRPTRGNQPMNIQLTAGRSQRRSNLFAEEWRSVVPSASDTWAPQIAVS
jgi:hypothetical protein